MLRPDTQTLWNAQKTSPLMRGAELVSGTALTLHLGHWVSGDLDFLWPDKRLREGRIACLSR